MPDFTVIEGGGQRSDPDANWASHHFRRMIVELLRAIARGDDPEIRVARCLGALVECLQKTPKLPREIIQTVIVEAFEDLNRGTMDHQEEIAEIVTCSLRLAAERLAIDDAAAGRASKADQKLDDAIRDHILSSEGRSRENGWSYLGNMMGRRFGDRPKPRAPKRGMTKPK